MKLHELISMLGNYLISNPNEANLEVVDYNGKRLEQIVTVDSTEWGITEQKSANYIVLRQRT